ncbi:enkurin [Tritrichomonas foetus]|uniref:Enkurin n=1 Tax=Tritrichomonas foetus TaxID=1144522 RepID=A0A1J4KUT2_9EUKA|nr:enkurin [Tritrichomonas foetus]|eukprot:OHT13269.1 enkurin [Tritrichomonas foetus]
MNYYTTNMMTIIHPQFKKKLNEIPLYFCTLISFISDMFDDEEETIYNLIPKPPPVIVKEPLHKSKYANSSHFETVKKRAHGTMGEPNDVMRKDPKVDYLKKGSRCRNLGPKERTMPHGQETLNKPPVPRQKEIPKQKPHPKKNLILENWKKAPTTKKLHPEKPVTWYTDKKDFGKVPKYLERVKDEYQGENAYWDEIREAMLPEDSETRCRLLTEEERLEILEGLNANLNDLKRRYGSLSFGMDHLSFRKKKENMEAEMAQIEADIKTFSRQNVYITES